MRTGSLLRDLWRQRSMVAVGAALAVVCGVLAGYRIAGPLPPRLESRQHLEGLASGAVLVDSPRSQVTGTSGIEDTIQGSAVDMPGLRTRAHLLTSLMATGPLAGRIATLAGIAPRRLIVKPPTGDGPAIGAVAPPVARAADPGVSVLDLSVDEDLPIIQMAIRGPDAATAARIARAAARALQEDVEASATADGVSPGQRLSILPLRPPVAITAVRGPGHAMMGGVAMAVVLLWCAALLTLPRLRRAWHAHAALDPPAADADAASPAAEAAVLDLLAPAAAASSWPGDRAAGSSSA